MKYAMLCISSFLYDLQYDKIKKIFVTNCFAVRHISREVKK